MIGRKGTIKSGSINNFNRKPKQRDINFLKRNPTVESQSTNLHPTNKKAYIKNKKYAKKYTYKGGAMLGVGLAKVGLGVGRIAGRLGLGAVQTVGRAAARQAYSMGKSVATKGSAMAKSAATKGSAMATSAATKGRAMATSAATKGRAMVNSARNKGRSMARSLRNSAVKKASDIAKSFGESAADSFSTRGFSMHKSLGKRGFSMPESLRNQGRAMPESLDNSSANQTSGIRSVFEQTPKSNERNLRVTQNKRNNVNNIIIDNSLYEPYHNKERKKYLCNPRELYIRLPNHRLGPYIIAKLDKIYYKIPIPNGTEPGSLIIFTQPTPPINNIGQNAPQCHTKEKPIIVNHIPGYNSNSRINNSRINFNHIRRSAKNDLAQKRINPESLKKGLSGMVPDSLKKSLSGINTNFLKNSVKKGLSRMIPDSLRRNVKTGLGLADLGSRMVARGIVENKSTINPMHLAENHSLNQDVSVNRPQINSSPKSKVQGLLKMKPSYKSLKKGLSNASRYLPSKQTTRTAFSTLGSMAMPGFT